MANSPTAQDILKLHQANRLTEAEAACRQALAVDPWNAQILLIGGNIALSMGDRAKGHDRLRALAGIAEAAPELRYHAALLLRQGGDLASAAEALRSLATQYPKEAFPVLLDLGQIEEGRGAAGCRVAGLRCRHCPEPRPRRPFTRAPS